MRTPWWSSLATMLAAVAPFPVQAPPVLARANVVTYQIVTNEIKAKQSDGTVVEVYRFDPGVFVVPQGTDVSLQIRGLKGHLHAVVLEGYDVRGVVRRNQTTTLHIHADKAGVYRLRCTTHADAAHEGPMEGYLVVLPSTR